MKDFVTATTPIVLPSTTRFRLDVTETWFRPKSFREKEAHFERVPKLAISQLESHWNFTIVEEYCHENSPQPFEERPRPLLRLLAITFSTLLDCAQS
jgi:hypothetical protein